MSATCYFASGKNADLSGSTYIPCNTTAVAEGGHSACCAPNDMCFTNGLCKAGADDQWNWNWRVGCTDPTFSDPACPSYCQGIESDNAAHLVFQCSDNENWCCATGNVDNFARNYNFTCCNDDDLKLSLGPAVFYGKATVSMAISTLASSSTATSSTQTSSTTQTTSDSQQTSASTLDAASFVSQSTAAASSSTDTPETSTSSSKTPLAAGLGVGIPVGLALVGLIAFLFYRLGQRQNRRTLAQQQEEESDKAQSMPIPVISEHSDGSQHSEALLSGQQYSETYSSAPQYNEAFLGGGDTAARVEIGNARSPVELEGKRMF